MTAVRIATTHTSFTRVHNRAKFAKNRQELFFGPSYTQFDVHAYNNKCTHCTHIAVHSLYIIYMSVYISMLITRTAYEIQVCIICAYMPRTVRILNGHLRNL